tara:strand:+ start:715 stop:1194 length:480 start_codon:yes stop_codon:yes gene_type:complete
MFKKILILFFFILFVGCGFKPMHKLSENSIYVGSYSVEIINSVSREIVEEINTNIISGENEKYKALLTIDENLTPLIINTNGTVAKYRIEISIYYQLIKVDENEQISDGTVRGFAQYDVGTSEINNEDTKSSMIKIATKNALQIMISKIQSSISQVNVN